MIGYFIKSLIRIVLYRFAVYVIDNGSSNIKINECNLCGRIFWGKPKKCKCNSVSFTNNYESRHRNGSKIRARHFEYNQN
jgi:hypothetical protein